MSNMMHEMVPMPVVIAAIVLAVILLRCVFKVDATAPGECPDCLGCLERDGQAPAPGGR